LGNHIFTLAAQLLSLPVTLYYFRRFSLVAWAANPVVLGGLAVVAGTISLPLGRLMGYLA
jgi:hypothetical protein